MLEEKQTPVPSISWVYKLVCGYIALRPKSVASVPADLEILWFFHVHMVIVKELVAERQLQLFLRCVIVL